MLRVSIFNLIIETATLAKAESSLQKVVATDTYIFVDHYRGVPSFRYFPGRVG